MISKIFDSQNQPKSDFEPILLKNRSFPGLGVNRKVVDNGLFYSNIDLQTIPWTQFWEKSKKPSKMAIFAKKKFL